MLKSVCMQKRLDNFKKCPKIYYEFGELIRQYRDKYGSSVVFDAGSLFDFTFEMHGHSRLKQMPWHGFCGAYALYLKIKGNIEN